jgi:transaldolase
MKLFLDTAEIEEIRTVARWGVLDGVTTNPTLFSRRSARSRRVPCRPRSWPRTSTGC